jgi:hypothetical protein
MGAVRRVRLVIVCLLIVCSVGPMAATSARSRPKSSYWTGQGTADPSMTVAFTVNLHQRVQMLGDYENYVSFFAFNNAHFTSTNGLPRA